jgi:glutathione S-transferase
MQVTSMQPKLIIGNKNYSTWSLRPWLLLREAGIDFEEQRILLDTDDTAYPHSMPAAQFRYCS